jgi:3-dehydroquinate dehydratase-2
VTEHASTGERRRLLLLSGPNLQLFGQREPEIYGTATLADLVERARSAADHFGFDLEHLQSDSEAELVAAVHGARDRVAGLIVNGGALSHYGWALHDALASFGGVIVELHVSNPDAREPWRRRSVITPLATGVIQGFGALGYELAAEAAARLIDQ